MPLPSKEEHRALIGLPDKGRRVVSLTKQSTVDTLLYGRDLDGSGESPHRGFMQTMHAAGYAGEPSGHKDAKQENRKRRAVLNCSSQLAHHDGQKSPHEEFMTRFADCAGARNTEARFKPLRAPGIAHTQSMGDIMNGLGSSRVERTPRGIRIKDMSAAGKKSERPEGKSCVTAAARCLQSSLQLGESEHPCSHFDGEFFGDYAGRAAKPKPTERSSVALKSLCVVDKLLYGRDLSFQSEDSLVQYAERYSGYAGNSWKIPKKFKQEAVAATAGYPENPELPGSLESPMPVAPAAQTQSLQGKDFQAHDAEACETEADEVGEVETNLESPPQALESPSLASEAPQTPQVTFDLGEPDAQINDECAAPEGITPDTPNTVPIEGPKDLREEVLMMKTIEAGKEPSRLTPFGVRRSSGWSSSRSSGSRTSSLSGQRPRWQ
ncbi:unnamed protein product [Durusdinium trenchii]|uniref:Uncharacterized protein n=2 Tax=Durusdinium trenchii TaxID=1381693 RepID=A0ABP0JTY2_9DINO